MVEPRQSRSDDIELTLPFGAKVRASGKQVTLILVIIIGVCAVLYLIREHDLRSKGVGEKLLMQQQEMVSSMENIGYILTLKQEQREALKLDMPQKLRRQLLESEQERRR